MKLQSKLLVLAVLALAACQTTEKATEKVISKTWLNQSIDFAQIKEVVNTYHMFDSTDMKVGSMVFGFSFENGRLVARDTSQFDNGSVYETAIFSLDTSDFILKEISIDMKMGPTSLDIDLTKSNGNVSGSYVVTRDTLVNEYPIDSAYQHDVVRSEMYMLFHTLKLKAGDSLTFTALAPTSMALSNASLTYEGTETVEVGAGSFECDVIWLKTDGKMPSNKIWISKESPRKVVKFYVPGPELNIELVSQR
ncbi:MAG: hypothetical protein Tsb0034_11150 [Ekhidna sp.]